MRREIGETGGSIGTAFLLRLFRRFREDNGEQQNGDGYTFGERAKYGRNQMNTGSGSLVKWSEQGQSDLENEKEKGYRKRIER